jgi:hypothetical protein
MPEGIPLAGIQKPRGALSTRDSAARILYQSRPSHRSPARHSLGGPIPGTVVKVTQYSRSSRFSNTTLAERLLDNCCRSEICAVANPGSRSRFTSSSYWYENERTPNAANVDLPRQAICPEP